MFLHQHPYKPFIPENATKLIVGTLPPPRFTTGELKPRDVDFCYGSIDGQLWPILNRIYNLDLIFENTTYAINQRKAFLENNGIGICDIVERAYRSKIDASDLGMLNVELRDLIGYLRAHPKVVTLLFTGGNSKNGPEYFFRKHLKKYHLALDLMNATTPKIHTFILDGRIITTVSLTAPSGSANRAVGSNPLYKKMKAENKSYTTIDFRVLQYTPYFKGEIDL
ncbi:hypothetical protein NBRC110019_11430 [Neptunitalea chrysea]|uniref:DNA glycosylase n=1 Tax=Neptunitalea chrysea TaxID=1647581 RepID=A0A9W6B3Z3_9FLAO|nr:uracil-DNA glycosylase family protein [Neptunitalea chrysea]GLB52104.1 hypothetical protein NBRC110019_11430 [Neptunitalea chrysea]